MYPLFVYKIILCFNYRYYATLPFEVGDATREYRGDNGKETGLHQSGRKVGGDGRGRMKLEIGSKWRKGQMKRNTSSNGKVLRKVEVDRLDKGDLV